MDGTSFLCIGVIIISIAIIVWIFYNSSQKREKIAVAERVYKSNLEQLKRSPSDTNLRQKALSSGREYARIAREGGKETLFDEVALMNDINAVAGGYSVKPTEEKAEIVAERSTSERLAELAKVKEQGLISEDEYNAKRSAILDEI